MQRTIHFRVTPSTVAVTRQVPLLTAVTVPSAPTVATLGSVEAQVTAELVPLTTRRQDSPGLERVKSSRLRVMEEDAVGCDVVISEGGVVAAGVESGRLQRTMHLRSPT